VGATLGKGSDEIDRNSRCVPWKRPPTP
jgi:hypothetical protein